MENVEKQIVRIIENNSPELAAEEILRLLDVVGRSEQLAAFLKWYYENDECPDLVTYESVAERYLSR